MKKEKVQFTYLILAALWGYFIFYLSSIPDLSSGFSGDFDFVFRKAAHIIVFAVLTYLLAKSLDQCKRCYFLFIIIVVVLYAFVDEFHQATVVSRSGNARDILIDSIGIYLGIWFYKDRVLARIFKPNKKLR